MKPSHIGRSLLLLAVLVSSVCGRAAGAGPPDAASATTATLTPGAVVSLKVVVAGTDEQELCGQFTLDAQGTLQLTVGSQPIEKLSLQGLTCDQAKDAILALIKRYFVAVPDVRIAIVSIPLVTVTVDGLFLHTGGVALPLGARLSDLFLKAPYLPNADLHHVEIDRAGKSGLRKYTVDCLAALLSRDRARDASNPVLQDGDVVHLAEYVAPAPGPAAPTSVMALGDVQSQGAVPYHNGMTVKDALGLAHGLRPTADTDRLTIRRKDGSIVTVSAARALQDVPTDNITLAPDDTLYVATSDSAQRIAVLGDVAEQKTLNVAGPLPLSKAITQAGGFKPDAETTTIVILRGMLKDPAHARAEVANYERIRKGQQADVDLKPGDIVQVAPKKKTRPDILGIGLSLLKFIL